MRSDLPTWTDARTVPDEAWASAWDAVEEPLRARLKTCLAALCQVYAPAAPPSVRLERVVRQGLSLGRITRPLDWALVLFDQDCPAAQVLAAAGPARLMGLQRVLVACVDGEFPDATLCGLELAGVDEAYAVSADEAVELVDHLFAAGPGVLLGVGDSDGLDKALSAAPKGSVWQGRAQDVAVNETAEGPDAALFTGLRLGPGQEGIWLWPGLWPERFLFLSLSVADAEDASGGGRP